MFLFNRKSRNLIRPDYSLLNADMHSHLLPGIDDGSPDTETSLQLIKGLKDLGYKKLVTTPHILWDVYKNTRDVIQQNLELLRNKLIEEKIEIDLEAAAEYFIDDHLQELLDKKEPLLFFGNKMVLVEFSMMSRPFDFKKILFDMQMQGYQPVLAHPERYLYLERSQNTYDELKAAGYLFQMNILSLSGYYGNAVMKLARHLAENKYYDLIGTDLHHFAHLQALQHPSNSSLLQQIFESEKILNRTL